MQIARLLMFIGVYLAPVVSACLKFCYLKQLKFTGIF